MEKKKTASKKAEIKNVELDENDGRLRELFSVRNRFRGTSF